MDQADIPEEVIDFIARRIDSVPHLEALLLLSEDGAKSWSDDEMSRRVYVSREQASGILEDLARHGLISSVPEAPDRYCYDGAWDVAGMMPRVAECYRRYLVPLSTFIHAKGASGAVKGFARAFRFKQKD